MDINENTTAFNRRRFLATTGLAGAGLVLAPRALNAQSASAPSNRATGNAINLGIVGVGAQGQVLLDSINAIFKLGQINIRLVAVCDIWPFQLDQVVRREQTLFPEVKGYSDIDDMLSKEKLDALFVASPDFWHARHTISGLKNGQHVYCEKMMARTADEGREMVRTSKSTGKLLQIGHQRRSNPNYRFAYNELFTKLKFLGRITNANAQWNRAVSDDLKMPKAKPITPENLKRYGYENAHEFRNWRWFKKYSNGPISDLGAHQIDIFNWVLGRPRSVIAAGGVDYYTTHEWYDNVMCIFDYDDIPGGTKGEVARAYYQVLTTTSSGGGYFENFMGIKGSFKISEQARHIKAYAEASSKAEFEAIAGKKIPGTNISFLTKEIAKPVAATEAKADVRDSAPPDAYDLNNFLGNKAIHQFHVENFLRTIRGDAGVTLNCDGEHAFKSEAPIFRVNEAVEAQKRLFYTDADFAI